MIAFLNFSMLLQLVILIVIDKGTCQTQAPTSNPSVTFWWQRQTNPFGNDSNNERSNLTKCNTDGCNTPPPEFRKKNEGTTDKPEKDYWWMPQGGIEPGSCEPGYRCVLLANCVNGTVVKNSQNRLPRKLSDGRNEKVRW